MATKRTTAFQFVNRGNVESALASAHRANIGRYRRLLKTDLTVHERAFVKRRLGEEEKALFEISQRATRVD